MNPSGVNLRETVVPPENQRLVGLLARRPFIWRLIRVQYRYRYAWQWRNDCPRAHAAWLGTKGAGTGTCMVPGLTLRPSCGQCSAFASIFAHLQEKRGSRSPGTGGMAAKCLPVPRSHSNTHATPPGPPHLPPGQPSAQLGPYISIYTLYMRHPLDCCQCQILSF